MVTSRDLRSEVIKVESLSMLVVSVKNAGLTETLEMSSTSKCKSA